VPRYAGSVSTVVLGPAPPQIDELIESRKRSGIHRLDEVWEGVLHMVPAPGFGHASVAQRLAVALDGPARAAGLIPAMHEFNLGVDEHDFRVPDGGLLREDTEDVWLPTAALVAEIVSPNDETWQKLPFYAAHRVDEVLIVEPRERAIHWLALGDDGEYAPVERSGLVELGPARLADTLGWS